MNILSDEVLIIVGELKSDVKNNSKAINEVKTEVKTMRSENAEQHGALETRLDTLSEAVSGLDGYLRGFEASEASGGSTGRAFTQIIKELKSSSPGTKALIFMISALSIVFGAGIEGGWLS